jgi:hypothetical protein
VSLLINRQADQKLHILRCVADAGGSAREEVFEDFVKSEFVPLTSDITAKKVFNYFHSFTAKEPYVKLLVAKLRSTVFFEVEESTRRPSLAPLEA